MTKKVAIVTGGTRGIGREISVALASADFSVVAVYSSNDEKAQEFCQQTGVSVLRWDVSDYEQCVQGVMQVKEQFGDISVLVNNAGITRDSTLQKMKLEQWTAVLRTNLDSCFHMCSQVVGTMRNNGFGRIINISSVNALAGQRGQTNYAAAKAGMIGFTKALAQETAKYGITVNAVAPGYIDTDMVRAVPEPILAKIVAGIPVNRLGRSDEIGKLVAYLTNDASGFITGTTISINGGQYMS